MVLHGVTEGFSQPAQTWVDSSRLRYLPLPRIRVFCTGLALSPQVTRYCRPWTYCPCSSRQWRRRPPKALRFPQSLKGLLQPCCSRSSRWPTPRLVRVKRRPGRSQTQTPGCLGFYGISLATCKSGRPQGSLSSAGMSLRAALGDRSAARTSVAVLLHPVAPALWDRDLQTVSGLTWV